MFYLKREEFIILPISFIVFLKEAKKNKRNINFAKQFTMSVELFEDILALIEEKGNDYTIALDMDRVDYPGKFFEELKELNNKIIFFNIKGNILIEKMKEDIQNLNWNDKEEVCCLNYTMSSHIINKYKSVLKNANIEYYIKIINQIKEPCDIEKPLLLDSSGLYSNMYINVKKVFLIPEFYYFILFGMAKCIDEEFDKYDGFISSSKNGAILASLLASMFRKKVVHILGVGPKYSMRVGNIQNEIKRGKSYIYVFDFICTGTEYKVLSALVNANDANLIGGIGFAQYSSVNSEKKMSFEKVNSLVTTSEAGIQYKIAGSIEDIKYLMNGLDIH